MDKYSRNYFYADLTGHLSAKSHPTSASHIMYPK